MYTHDQPENIVVVALAAFGFMKLLEGFLVRQKPTIVVLDGDASNALRELLAEPEDD